MDEQVVPIIVVGARGRMGKALLQNVLMSDILTLLGAVDRSGSPGIGQDAGALIGMSNVGVKISDDLDPRRGSIVVDFSLPEATENNIQRCIERGVPLVLGTSGVGERALSLLKVASQSIPVVFAANFSVGVSLLTRLAAQAAKALGEDWDCEIFEMHHQHKRDAPSGTALRVGQAIASATDRDLNKVQVTGRSGSDHPRQPQEIGFAAARGGDSTGEHTVFFFGQEERLELTHRSFNRAIFARGALRAATWVAQQKPGLYDMSDVLGFPSS